MQKGDKYKRVSDGVEFVFLYSTPRAVMIQSVKGGFCFSVARRDFERDYQEVKPRGRKAASSK